MWPSTFQPMKWVTLHPSAFLARTVKVKRIIWPNSGFGFCKFCQYLLHTFSNAFICFSGGLAPQSSWFTASFHHIFYKLSSYFSQNTFPYGLYICYATTQTSFIRLKIRFYHIKEQKKFLQNMISTQNWPGMQCDSLRCGRSHMQNLGPGLQTLPLKHPFLKILSHLLP